MCPPPFLITASRRRRHSLINETLLEFLPLGDYRSLQFLNRLELSLVVDSLLKSTLCSVIHGINIRAILKPHVIEVQWSWWALFSDSPSWCALALRFAAVSTCITGGNCSKTERQRTPRCPVMTTCCSDVRQQTLLEDDIAVVWAVNFRSGIDDDHPRLPPYEILIPTTWRCDWSVNT